MVYRPEEDGEADATVMDVVLATVTEPIAKFGDAAAVHSVEAVQVEEKEHSSSW